MTQGDVFRTPSFKAIPNDFVVKRSSCSQTLDLSPIPDNFATVADEDLWLQLNKGCTTNLDMLQMTPNLKQHSLSSTDISLVSILNKYLQPCYVCILASFHLNLVIFIK